MLYLLKMQIRGGIKINSCHRTSEFTDYLDYFVYPVKKIKNEYRI